MNEQIVICMPLKNGEKTVERAINSFLSQQGNKRNIILLIGNDQSTDTSIQIIEKYLSNPNIILINVDFGNVSDHRNFLNNYARIYISGCVLIGRLDADDVIYDAFTIAKIEELYDQYQFDVLIGGNQQSSSGIVLDWQNKPSKMFLEENYLKNRLLKMSQGDSKAELPSCNTFITPQVSIEYPSQKSAEDHWFMIFILLSKDKFTIHIEENLIYCIYSLDGFNTKNNHQQGLYLKSRQELYQYFIQTIEVK